MFMSKTKVTLECENRKMRYVEYYTVVLILVLIKVRVTCTNVKKNKDPRKIMTGAIFDVEY